MKKLALATAFVALLTVAATGAWANAIPPQLTLSSSYAGGVEFLNNAGVISFWFTGGVADCGHANCVSGNVLLEPQLILGNYWMWITGLKSPSLTGGPSDFAVNMNGSSINLAVQLAGGETLSTTLNLTNAVGGMTMTPGLDGTFSNATSFGIDLQKDFPNGTFGFVDFTVAIQSGPRVGKLGNGQWDWSYISSGELAPSPEPTSLALLGTGVLGLAGAIRRKMNR